MVYSIKEVCIFTDSCDGEVMIDRLQKFMYIIHIFMVFNSMGLPLCLLTE